MKHIIFLYGVDNRCIKTCTYMGTSAGKIIKNTSRNYNKVRIKSNLKNELDIVSGSFYQN